MYNLNIYTDALFYSEIFSSFPSYYMSVLKRKQWKTCYDNQWITSAVVSGRKESVVPKDYFCLCQCQPRLFTQLLDQSQ